MTKRRILILEQQSFRGGAQRVLEVVLDGLRDRIDPIVALPESGPFEQDLRRRGIETLTFPLGRYRSGRKSLANILSFAPRSLYSTVRIARTIVRRQVDLVYINGPRWVLAGALAARITGRPSLFCLHNTLSRRLDVALAARASGLVSRIVACSRAAAVPLLRENPALRPRTDVLYPPSPELPAEFLRDRERAGRFVIGMVGRITEAKGHHVLLEALAKLGPSSGMRLLIVGAPGPGSEQDAQYLRSLHASTTQAGLNGLIDWVGYQADPDPYYASIDALAAPSTIDEGMPVVVLEAFRRGIPVIASRSGGIPELVENGANGMLVAPGDPAALAEVLSTLRDSPALGKRLGAAARASLDARFSPAFYCSTLDQIICGLCSPDAAPESAPALEKIGS
jgi:glycosyltransferase involved in cell wall biosynthesis